MVCTDYFSLMTDSDGFSMNVHHLSLVSVKDVRSDLGNTAALTKKGEVWVKNYEMLQEHYYSEHRRCSSPSYFQCLTKHIWFELNNPLHLSFRCVVGGRSTNMSSWCRCCIRGFIFKFKTAGFLPFFLYSEPNPSPKLCHSIRTDTYHQSYGANVLKWRRYV